MCGKEIIPTMSMPKSAYDVWFIVLLYCFIERLSFVSRPAEYI